MTGQVHHDTVDGVATITLDHQDNRNALSAALVNGLGDSLLAADAEETTRVIVLTNVGSTFCAGADLKGGGTDQPRYTLPQLLQQIQGSATPVIGRIAGHCTGGGVGLAAACDISIAADDVQLGFTEVRLGVAPAMISVVCLPKMRRGDAMELFLSGERITAGRAAEVGLLNRAVPAVDLDAAVASLAARIARGGPQALAVSKALVLQVPPMTQDDAWTWTEQVSRELFTSPEAAEGITAFREKRNASWVADQG